MVFFWRQPRKRADDVLLQQMLERTSCLKEYKYSPTESGRCCVVLVCLAIFCWHWFSLTTLGGIGTPYHSLLVIVCHDFIEKNTPKNFCWCSSAFLPLQRSWANWTDLWFFQTDLLWLIHKWCLWVLPLLIRKWYLWMDQVATNLCEPNILTM